MNDDMLLRQALGRQNERAAKMKMPADMAHRVMEHTHRRRRPLWLYPAIAASIAIAWLIGSNLLHTDSDTTVCYTTLENGQRITDHTIVMSHVEATLTDIFSTDK